MATKQELEAELEAAQVEIAKLQNLSPDEKVNGALVKAQEQIAALQAELNATLKDANNIKSVMISKDLVPTTTIDGKEYNAITINEYIVALHQELKNINSVIYKFDLDPDENIYKMKAVETTIKDDLGRSKKVIDFVFVPEGLEEKDMVFMDLFRQKRSAKTPEALKGVETGEVAAKRDVREKYATKVKYVNQRLVQAEHWKDTHLPKTSTDLITNNK